MDQQELLRNTLQDRYSIERELGGGGMSRVFLARETQLGRPVVIKVLPVESSGAVSIERFKREIQVAAQLQQANIVPLLAAGEVDGVPYFVMPYVEGESLRARLAREGELPVVDVIGILREVARALAYAHDHGVVHRDIKPDNVLLSGGSAVVTDFGVAKALSASKTSDGSGLTSLGVALGTPAYMSPEQASADPHVDHRADIYAVGAMAYELLTGQPPFAGRTASAMLAAHVSEVPEAVERRRRSVPPLLAALVLKCLEKRPADRPQSAAEILRTLELVPSSSDAMTPTTAKARIGVRSLMIAATAALIVIAVGIYAVLSGKSGQASASSIHSIAVLPFENVGGDTATAYFSDGMRDEIANALSKIPSLSVASRTSSYAFRGKNKTLQEIGRELHVDAVLEGTVRRAGDRLRIAAQLTRVESGMGLWSDSYERQVADVFAVQEELAKSIAGTLSTNLDGSTKGVPVVSVAATRGTSNSEAYDAYLRGRFLFNNRRNLAKAVQFFDEAIAKDSMYASAYAALATAYALMPYYENMPTRSAVPRLRAAATRALALDPRSAEAHAALAFGLAQTYRWPEAEEEFKRATAADSTFANAYHWYGYVLAGTGRDREALPQYAKAVRLDPLAMVYHQNYALSLLRVGQLAQAQEIIRRMMMVAPDDPLTRDASVLVALESGKVDSVLRALDSATFNSVNRVVRPSFAYWFKQLGRTREADSLGRLLIRTAGPGDVGDLAETYAALGDLDHAFIALNQAIDKADGSLMGMALPSSLLWSTARKDPRFNAALARMNLPWVRKIQ